MEEQIGPLCQSVAVDVASYASANRPKTKGSQKNKHLGELLYGIAAYGNDEILTAFFSTNLEKFSDPKTKMGSAFLGRLMLCGVHAFLAPTDEKRVAFQKAYDAESKSIILTPDPDKKIPTKKDRPGYVAHIKDAVTTKLAGLDKPELFRAYLSLFKTVCTMEDTPLRGHLVDALKAHFNKNVPNFAQACLAIRALDTTLLNTLLTLEPTQKVFFEENKDAQPVIMQETHEEEATLTFDREEDDSTSRLLTAKILAEDLKDPATSSYVKSMREYAARQPKFSSVPVLGGLIQGKIDYAPIGEFLANVCILDTEMMLASLYTLLRKLSTDDTLKGKVETSVFVQEQLQAAFQFSITEANRKPYEEKNKKIKLSALTYQQKVAILQSFEKTVFAEYLSRQQSGFDASEAAQQSLVLLRPIMNDVLTESTTYEDRKIILQALLYYFSAVKNRGDNNSAAAFKAKVLELKYDSMHQKFQQLCEKTLPQISTEIGEYRTDQVRQLPEAAAVAAASEPTTTVESTEQPIPVAVDGEAAGERAKLSDLISILDISPKSGYGTFDQKEKEAIHASLKKIHLGTAEELEAEKKALVNYYQLLEVKSDIQKRQEGTRVLRNIGHLISYIEDLSHTTIPIRLENSSDGAAMAEQRGASPQVARAAQPPRATVVVVAADSAEAQQAQRDEVGVKTMADRARAILTRRSSSSSKVADADKQSDKSLTK